MPGQNEIKRLLVQLHASANAGEGGGIYGASHCGARSEETTRTSEELRAQACDVTFYKHNQAWPGRKYVLIGNSYKVDGRIVATTDATKRTACIAVMLEKGRENRRCVSVEDAFVYSGFVECLSRFEFDWLKRQPPSTLIGPAYDATGRLIPEAFAVWQRVEVGTKATTKNKQPVLASR